MCNYPLCLLAYMQLVNTVQTFNSLFRVSIAITYVNLGFLEFNDNLKIFGHSALHVLHYIWPKVIYGFNCHILYNHLVNYSYLLAKHVLSVHNFLFLLWFSYFLLCFDFFGINLRNLPFGWALMQLKKLVYHPLLQSCLVCWPVTCHWQIITRKPKVKFSKSDGLHAAASCSRWQSKWDIFSVFSAIFYII